MRHLKLGLKVVFATLSLLTVLFTIGVLWPDEQAIPVARDKPIIIKGASIIDVQTGEVRREPLLVIKNRQITYVGDSEGFLAPENAIEIAGEGKFVIPSLWDMHTHIFKITPLLDLPLYIAYGVTNVRDMTSCPKANDPFASCPEDFKRWDEMARNNQLLGPRIQGTASWHLNGPGIHDYVKGLPEFFGTETPEQARDFARYYAGRVDALKVYNYISKDAYLALADEARKLGLDVVGHRPHAVSAVEAAQHQKSIEHARFILHESFPGAQKLRNSVAKGEWQEDRRKMLDDHDPRMAQAIFAAMRENGTWYVPTHLTRRIDALGTNALEVEKHFIRYLHPLLKWQWLEDVNKTVNQAPSQAERDTYMEFYQKGLELTGQAHRAGVKVLAGTDYTVAGITLHEELEQLTLAGLSPLEALQSATILPAKYFGLEHKYGGIKQGMAADLILLNKNPLVNIRNTLTIDTVIFNGNLYDREQLNDIKRLMTDRAKSWSIACKILWQFIKNPVGY